MNTKHEYSVLNKLCNHNLLNTNYDQQFGTQKRVMRWIVGQNDEFLYAFKYSNDDIIQKSESTK